MTSLVWRKLGRILRAEGQRPWMHSHTACPVALHLNGDLYRIYFGTRDPKNHPRIGFVEVDLSDPLRVLTISAAPALEPGPPGHFDDNGVYPGCLLEKDGRLWLYYMGRSNGEAPRYSMAIGLATSVDGGMTFERLHAAPILDRSDFDPCMVSTPYVMRERSLWRVWYLSGFKWDLERGKSYYHIKYAESDDGVHWRRDGRVAIRLQADETNIASPTVYRDLLGYHMWYCALKDHYRLGYARSSDGVTWTRLDAAAGIELSPAGWDSESMAYPHAFAHGGRLWLLYSGNGFGRDGFGLATAELA